MKNNNIKTFDNIKYIVEFEIYSNLYQSAPYYLNAGVSDNVVIYDDGTMDIMSHVIRNHMNNTYKFNNTSEYIKSITDCHEHYNCSEKLK